MAYSGFNRCQVDCPSEQPHQHSHVVLLPSRRGRPVVHERIPGGDVDPGPGVGDPEVPGQPLGGRDGPEERNPAGTRSGSNLGHGDPGE